VNSHNTIIVRHQVGKAVSGVAEPRSEARCRATTVNATADITRLRGSPALCPAPSQTRSVRRRAAEMFEELASRRDGTGVDLTKLV